MPDQPSKKVGVDLFDLWGKTFVVMVDYYSRYTDVAHFSSSHLCQPSVIEKIKDIDAQWGHQDVLFIDNGPQLSRASSLRLRRRSHHARDQQSPLHPVERGGGDGHPGGEETARTGRSDECVDDVLSKLLLLRPG